MMEKEDFKAVFNPPKKGVCLYLDIFVSENMNQVPGSEEWSTVMKKKKKVLFYLIPIFRGRKSGLE